MGKEAKKQRNPDHVRRMNKIGENNEVIEERMKDLLTPAVLGQEAYYRSLGMRARILNLPLMVGALLMMLWRQVPSVCELVKALERENLLWTKAVKVSQQAMSKRLLNFPADLFKQILMGLLPVLKERWQARQRPLPDSITAALKNFKNIRAVDGSTLEALFRKLDSLQDAEPGKLAGKICTVIDLATRLPEEIWFTEEALAHDSNFLKDILKMTEKSVLWIFDRGFYDFEFFDKIIQKGGAFITRLKANAVYKIKETVYKSGNVNEYIIELGGSQKKCQNALRLIEVRFGTQWYRYITSVLDTNTLSGNFIADLYRRRWRIEESFLIVKRLLNLSYLWTGSSNGVMLQVWATWLFFAVLVDLGDSVAEALMLPFDRISLEMVFRELYHFIVAYNKGKATDPVSYFAAPENQDLGVVKRIRKKPVDNDAISNEF